MDTSQELQMSKVCDKHNQPIILLDQQQNLPLCLICVQEKTGMVLFDQISKQLKEIKSDSDKEFQEKLQILQKLLESILAYKQNMVIGIDKIIQIITDQIKHVNEYKKKFQGELNSNNHYNKIDQLKDQLKKEDESYQIFKIQIKKYISEFQQKFMNADFYNQIFTQSEKNSDVSANCNCDSKIAKVQIVEIKQVNTEIQEKFQYELIGRSNKNELGNHFAFALNKDNTILIIGDHSNLKVYQFNKGVIGNELQTIRKHRGAVYCLNFMKQSNNFVSGSQDSSIIIWQQDQYNQWAPQYILEGHKDKVNCLLMNINENLMISGCEDGNIKLWKKEINEWSCLQTLKDEKEVYAMSMNETENKLITCGQGAYVNVYEIQQNKQLVLKQKINVSEFGYRLCFTIKDQFLFQPIQKDYLEKIDYDSNQKQFKTLPQVKIQSCQTCCTLFPCQYIKELNILFIKHGQYLNIFRINQNRKYELIQTINYEHDRLYGTVSNDGQYLITWDKKQSEIQVRELKKMNK